MIVLFILCFSCTKDYYKSLHFPITIEPNTVILTRCLPKYTICQRVNHYIPRLYMSRCLYIRPNQKASVSILSHLRLLCWESRLWEPPLVLCLMTPFPLWLFFRLYLHLQQQMHEFPERIRLRKALNAAPSAGKRGGVPTAVQRVTQTRSHGDRSDLVKLCASWRLHSICRLKVPEHTPRLTH